MPTRGKIQSDKIVVKEIFSRMWFRIPEYQRPYIWGVDEVNELLDDLTYAMTEKPDFEYFLGSLVFQSRIAAPERGQEYNENDLLDGQQRMTTILLLFAVIRDLSENLNAKKACQKSIFLEGNEFSKTPERTRLVFTIRETVQEFIDEYIKPEGGTTREEELMRLIEKADNLSTQNMARSVIEIRKYFHDNPNVKPENLLTFLLNNVLLIYVSTEELEDAFRLFTILNDRGIPLRNSDILKSINIGALETQEQILKYAKMWEEAESELGDDFDRFLNHVRTILVKEKARMSLLQEFEDKIYEPMERDKTTGQKKPVLLTKGRDTFEFIERFLEHYTVLFDKDNFDEFGTYKFNNLINIMLLGLPATDWVPPLLLFFDKFRYNHLIEFTSWLDNKFSADWISQYTPTDRIEAMNNILKGIDDAKNVDDVLNSNYFKFDMESFVRGLDGPIYGKRFTRYILLKLDYLFNNHDHRMNFKTLSVEHILPQHPTEYSQWAKDFTFEERFEWTDRLGNLVLITRRKNSSLGRLDYIEKKNRYFENNIETCPNSLHVLLNDKWTLVELKANHQLVLHKLWNHYGIDETTIMTTRIS